MRKQAAVRVLLLQSQIKATTTRTSVRSPRDSPCRFCEPQAGSLRASVFLRGPTHVGLVLGSRRRNLKFTIERAPIQPIRQAIPRAGLGSVRFKNNSVCGWEGQTIANNVALRIEIDGARR